MRLNDKERLILSALQFRGDAPASELSEITRLPEHVIHYYLNRYREEGIIRRWAFIDMFALGLEEYEIYFSLVSQSKNNRDPLLKTLKEHPQIVWLAELGGDYQCALTLCASSVQEVYSFIESLTRKFGNIFFRKSVAVIVSFTIFAKKYLADKELSPDYDRVTMQDYGRRYKLDNSDRQVLAVLFRPDLQSNIELAQAAGIPRSTLEYRLKKLQAEKVIQCFVNHIRTAELGMQVYKLLIYTQGFQNAFHQNLFAFCRKHKFITNFTHCLGSWDYEIGLDVSEPRQANVILEEVYQQFGGNINNIQLLPVFAQTNSVNFMSNLKPSNLAGSKKV